MSVMETEYRQFRSSDSTPVYEREHSMPAPKGLKSVVAYFLYGVLVLLLLILLMVTGIKFSQLNKDISDVKLQLQSINKAGSTSGSHSSPIVQDVPLKSVAPVKGLCREGWSSYQRSCYLLSTSGLVWHQADQQCRTHGGHLLVLNSMEELDYISQIVELRFNYWIGLVEREEDHWTWVDGTFFNSTQAFWDEGQPDNWDFRENGEDCGQLHASLTRKRKRWNDADCGLQYRYICERSV
ncbi:asialoglycoprotein receptor-like 1 %2C GO:0016020 [Xyrichtys novacula]|uniref:Asialoglycoprotein receptor-like 1, GO:0016020 n=1 Tax=Xyrichtys novacula TaxID=13765 RepID=A0AAV1G3S0_XYRNO|nr:asialoglycoprotein receptor-like 1 %2C GO:0016020 [Xyrichtys novacula]